MKHIVFLLAISVQSQPILDLSNRACSSGDPSKPKITALFPATIAAGSQSGNQVLVPICLQLGVGLRINMDAVGGPAIEATTPTVSSIPRLVKKVILTTDLPQNQTAIPYTLDYTPAGNTLVMARYRGSARNFWTDSSDEIIPEGKLIVIKIPSSQLISPGDTLTLIYWTNEPPLAP